MKIVSIDPGTTSGLVVWEGPRGVYQGKDMAAGLLDAQEVREDTWLKSAYYLADEVIRREADVLLYENFVLRGGAGHSSDAEALDSVRVTSGLLAYLDIRQWRGKVVPFDTSIKAVMTDMRMRSWGLWIQPSSDKKILRGLYDLGIYPTGFKGHATDAARGLAWYGRQGMKVKGKT